MMNALEQQDLLKEVEAEKTADNADTNLKESEIMTKMHLARRGRKHFEEMVTVMQQQILLEKANAEYRWCASIRQAWLKHPPATPKW